MFYCRKEIETEKEALVIRRLADLATKLGKYKGEIAELLREKNSENKEKEPAKKLVAEKDEEIVKLKCETKRMESEMCDTEREYTSNLKE